MVPNTVLCEDCGRVAAVRGYGRVEYDWPKTITDGQVVTIPTITSIRLTLDCPQCGVKVQDFYPNGRPKTATKSTLQPRATREVRPRRVK